MAVAFSDSIRAFYEKYDEANRLTTGVFQLELARTQEILLRFLPAPPAMILDIGGGPGIYSCWLAQLGYEAHLLDPIAGHLERAKESSTKQLDHPIASFTSGDARQLHFADHSADVVLMLGPLYHLHERQDRLMAIKAAYRVLRQNGRLFAAVISRFASALDGLFLGKRAESLWRECASDGHRAETVAPTLVARFHKNTNYVPNPIDSLERH